MVVFKQWGELYLQQTFNILIDEPPYSFKLNRRPYNQKK